LITTIVTRAVRSWLASVDAEAQPQKGAVSVEPQAWSGPQVAMRTSRVDAGDVASVVDGTVQHVVVPRALTVSPSRAVQEFRVVEYSVRAMPRRRRVACGKSG